MYLLAKRSGKKSMTFEGKRKELVKKELVKKELVKKKVLVKKNW